jgi:hypothetical protein
MIAGMSLCDDNGQENTLQGSQDIDPGNSDDAGTMMEGCEQTPIRDEIPGPRRLPLRDISARLAVTDDALVSFHDIAIVDCGGHDLGGKTVLRVQIGRPRVL